MSRELRLLQETNRRARAAEAEVTRVTPLLEQRAREGWHVAEDERAALTATVARLERRLEAERHQAARDLTGPGAAGVTLVRAPPAMEEGP